jgi:hypothetical protein
MDSRTSLTLRLCRCEKKEKKRGNAGQPNQYTKMLVFEKLQLQQAKMPA